MDYTVHLLVFAATIWTLLCGYAKEKNVGSVVSGMRKPASFFCLNLFFDVRFFTTCLLQTFCSIFVGTPTPFQFCYLIDKMRCSNQQEAFAIGIGYLSSVSHLLEW